MSSSAGDEILEINGNSLEGLTHQEAVTRFKQLKKGAINIRVKSRLSNLTAR